MELKTWEDIKWWEDIMEPGIKDTIRTVLSRTPKEKRCPHLGEIVEDKKVEWVYCGVDRKKYAKIGYEEESPIPTLNDPRYHASVDWGFIQLFCTSDFKKCVDYAEKTEKPEEAA